MPIALADFPRPPQDNGRGLHGSAAPGWKGGKEGYAFWIRELAALNIKWFKVIDDNGDSVPLCEQLLAAGIFPIVRILRRDPPPNDSPEPNPGHLGETEEKTIRRLIDAGVRYFETNHEPNLRCEWKHEAMPANALEAAKLVALNWLFDARLILSLGGYPGLPAISNGSQMDLMGALVSLGRHEILLEGCWIAVHNYGGNRPLNFPDDPINRSGGLLTAEQYAQGAFTDWAWWNLARKRADTLAEINELRLAGINPAPNLQTDHACVREHEYYNTLAIKYLGRAIPILSTEGGWRVGRRDDLRYPRITPAAHRELTLGLFDHMQRTAPDYYFAAMPWLLIESADFEADAWRSPFWKNVLTHGAHGHAGLPSIAVPEHGLGDHLPVMDAIKAMENLARRLPGAQPAPPPQPILAVAPPPSPENLREEKSAPPAPKGWASWLSDEPPPAPAILPPSEPLTIPAESLAPVFAPPSEPLTIPAESPAPVFAPPSEPPTTPAESPTPVFAPPSEPLTIPAEPPAPMFAPPASPPPFDVETLNAPHFEEEAEPPAPRVPAPKPAKPSLPPQPSFTLPAQTEEVEWDWRLDALGARLEPAQTKPGQVYWKLVRAIYQGPDESNDNHHIYYLLADERDQPVAQQSVWQGWSGDQTPATTNEQGTAEIPLWLSFARDLGQVGPYAAWVEGVSDRVTGLGLPLKRHVNFVLMWRRTRAR